MTDLDNSRTLLSYLETLIAARKRSGTHDPGPEDTADARESLSLQSLDEWASIFQQASTEKLESLRDRVCLAGLRAIDAQLGAPEIGPQLGAPAQRTDHGNSTTARNHQKKDGDRACACLPVRCRARGAKRFALVAMPWFWPHMPSIQLAIVKDVLAAEGIESDVLELYVHFLDIVGTNLYREMANMGTYIGELLFTQFYFDGMRPAHDDDMPDLYFLNRKMQEDFLLFGTPLAHAFLEECLEELCRRSYDAICFTLTAQQTGATIALCKRIRERRPEVPIIVGGAACAGEMGTALLEICPEIDIAVHGEAERVLPSLIGALEAERPLAGVDGISWRDGSTIRTNGSSGLHRLSRTRNRLGFDAYFERVATTRVLADNVVWLPFESSRGCWYGEKVQCTFCGLNEIITYRERDNGGLLGELEAYEARYGVRNFFAVDLIMPRSFFRGLLPAIEAAAKDWTIFYEVKSNMRRKEIKQLARAGVRWIQPGIESLDDDVLRLMRKGVSAAQNVQTLRISRQLGITASWNLISNFPGERAESYEHMERLIPLLHHLDPPSGMSPFEVHRFSPFHASPEKLGIRILGAHDRYRYVFPVDDAVLDRLVYRFRYKLLKDPDERLSESHRRVAAAITRWKEARQRGARFHAICRSDGTAQLVDSRTPEATTSENLDRAAARLLQFLDDMRPRARLAAMFCEEEPDAFLELGGKDGLCRLIERWKEDGVLLEISGTVQALPTIDTPPVHGAITA